MKTSVNINQPHYNAKYANWLNILIELIQPKNLYVVAGRGANKTTSIQAKRFQNISYDMPHAYFAWCATTYMDAMDNIVPSLIEGLKRHGWKEGKHFVTDARPPAHFKLPYKSPKSYKHTLSTFLGTFTQIVSVDQITGAAGGSFQHLYIDEGKNIPEKKLKKLTPAIRGGEYVTFSRSPFYRGRTATTDMPNPTENEYDWILAHKDNMNVEQIKKIIEIGLVLNEIRIDFSKAYALKNASELKRIQKRLLKWKEYWYRARYDSTFYIEASTFANIDILTQGYFQEVLEDEGPESFLTTILTLPPSVKKGDRFYTNLSDIHFFEDGVRNDYYDNFNLIDDIKPSSEALRYCNRDERLEAGVDFGNMCSMVIGQQKGRFMYILKNIHTLAPEEAPHLAKKFRDFFRYHKRKELDLYYDRSGNQNRLLGRDWATDLKYHIEYENGNSTGWKVNLMSINQGNIYQNEEYLFMKNLLGETNVGLPKVRIDKFQCRELKSSLELTKTKVDKNEKGSTIIKKNKTSEKLALPKLPMYSTNYSDAFKYLMCRKYWMKISNRRSFGYTG